MMLDQCSVKSYEEIVKSGYVGRKQAQYFYVFVHFNTPLTHKEASAHVKALFGGAVPARNGRIAELEHLGLIEKADHVTDPETKKLVNRWRWSRRLAPAENLPTKIPRYKYLTVHEINDLIVSHMINGSLAASQEVHEAIYGKKLKIS